MSTENPSGGGGLEHLPLLETRGGGAEKRLTRRDSPLLVVFCHLCVSA